MPESPEVQELATFLRAHTVGRLVRSADVLLPKALKTSQPPLEALVGRRITDVRRFGKMIDVVSASDADALLHVVVHFGHDGWVLWHPEAPADLTRAGEATLMARFRLDDGAGFDLTDAGQWKALTIHVVADAAEVPAVAKLGPDPMAEDFDPENFASVLAGRRKQVKALLQDQTAFAGIGNAYSDEILHAAKISPVVHASSLSAAERLRLAEVTRRTLREATAARRGVAPADLRATKHAALQVHRKTGATCAACGDRIREYTFSGATAQYCPTCQTGGDLLA